MLVLCVLLTFSIVCVLACVIILAFIIKRNFEELNVRLDGFMEQFIILSAWADRFDRKQDELKASFEDKFGPSIVTKINAILKMGAKPSKIVMDEKGKLHKVNRAY